MTNLIAECIRLRLTHEQCIELYNETLAGECSIQKDVGLHAFQNPNEYCQREFGLLSNSCSGEEQRGMDQKCRYSYNWPAKKLADNDSHKARCEQLGEEYCSQERNVGFVFQPNEYGSCELVPDSETDTRVRNIIKRGSNFPADIANCCETSKPNIFPESEWEYWVGCRRHNDRRMVPQCRNGNPFHETIERCDTTNAPNGAGIR